MTRFLARRLGRLLHKEVRVTLTDNTRALIRARRRGRSGYLLRLHRIFATADAAVLAALAMVIAGRMLPPGQEETLRDFLRRNRRRIRERRPGAKRSLTLCPHGVEHDLQRIMGSVNERYFEGKVSARITWGRAARTRRIPRTISLGQYCFERKVIFVHPCLDQRFVPRYVVENVIFHEMLHHEMGETIVKGRRITHTPEFCRQERRYRKFERAERWKDRHLDRLLRYRP